MGNLRPVLLVTLLFLGYLLWVEWQKDYGPKPAERSAAPVTSFEGEALPPVSVTSDGDLPMPLDAGSGRQQEESTSDEPAVMQAARRQISVRTDVFDVEIDPVGGTVTSVKLLDYPESLDTPGNKVQLLVPQGPERFIAQSGLLSHQSAPNHTSEYRSERMEYALAEGADELRVPLTWSSEDGIEVTKSLIFTRGGYDITVRHQVEKNSGGAWAGSRYDQLQRTVPEDEEKGGFNNPGRYSFKGIAFYSPDEKFEKIDFDDVADDPYERSFSEGWLSMVQHYFFVAWIPPGDEIASYSTKALRSDGWPRYIAREVSELKQAAAGGRTEFSSRLYAGPKLQDQLPDLAPGLEHTVNYGIFTVFSKPLYWLLAKIHSMVGNWGWSIILLTILIKAAFFKLTEAQYRSMARMRKLQPRIESLKERYGDDRQGMSQAMMELYKKEKVNPLGGCLPILVQIPIFIALYWVLIESVELRQAPFILWIQNLSARDPYFILPALNAIFMIATQRLTPTTGMDPMQAKMMKMMPVVFSVMFAFFPAGLVLYWATNAGLSLAQQYYITRKIAGPDAK
jgi:YidC/Oxa1 family membrane protein insertase